MIRSLDLEKSRLDLESQGFSQRLRSLDESEQRYKDENWSLETQTHELIAAAKESAAKEQRLQQLLAVATSEKSTAQRELDDIKQAHGKLSDEYSANRKSHEAEISSLRRTATTTESERNTLQRKVDELTSQNQELVKAVAGRFRADADMQIADIGSEPEELSLDKSDPEHSPPPSPSKGAVRNSLLESETLKTSLHHAYRMIQNLKTTIHREKTEKLELKRMLQEARDELEVRRGDLGAGNGNKRAKTKSQSDLGKKIAKSSQLGIGRTGHTEIELDDPEWEDHNGGPSSIPADRTIRSTDVSDAYQTANETEDAFETANELETSTETEAFQTGNEDIGGDNSDDLTETEGGPVRSTGASRNNTKLSLAAAKRQSFVSTASTSDEEYDQESRTPVHQQPPKYRLKIGRGSRRSRMGTEAPDSEPSSMKGSPASFISNGGVKGQSLFAELGDFGEDDSGDEVAMNSTPAMKKRSRTASPTTMVDSDTMTDLQESSIPTQNDVTVIPAITDAQDLAEIPFSMTSSAVTTVYSVSPSQDAHTTENSKPLDSASSTVLHTRPVLGLSDIRQLEIIPVYVPKSDGPSTAVQTDLANRDCGNEIEREDDRKLSKPGVLGTVFGWATGKTQPVEEVAEPGTKDVPQTSSVDGNNRTVMGDISANIVPKIPAPSQADQSSQTVLRSDQIDKLLGQVDSPSTKPTLPPISITKSISPPLVRNNSSQDGKDSPRVASPRDVLLNKSVKRPGSSGSIRSSTATLPPLPIDHRETIAAAQQQQQQQQQQQTPVKESSVGTMGPPLAPASSYRTRPRQPQTPVEQALQSPASRASTTPRPRYSTARSARSRRSSVSSFESEIDARFNIRADGVPVQGADNSTDPRMIQAITQTMIGEYLWKYTRKAGRGEMSDNRHRRFFWVHPYTRTLYWSDQDPSTAGRVQLKAKSVAIEAVRVVVDDNPMPPGLHRKSLIVITPGRDVKFTATTGQRHETWFNALSYLLLRSGPEPQFADGTQLTAEDVAEFNPGFGRPVSSRMSLSSYNSHTNTTRHSRASSRAASPTKNSVRRIPATPHASSSSRYSNPTYSSIGSRLSSYLRPGRMSATRETEGSGSIYNASVVNDSAEDVRAVLEKQEQEADRLENVRACCDGENTLYSQVTVVFRFG